ncbi:MAG: sulfatase [Verrucomicrobiota bacterium]
MMQKARFTFASLRLCASLFFLSSFVSAETKPNIVFILADDLGITDINAYARHFNDVNPDELFYETPNLDKLVADGIAFSESYANQLCSPTRAAILTGRIASTLGVTTATPNTQTYFNQGLTPPENFNPHDVLMHKDPIKGKRPWINATSNTAIDPTLPTWPKVLKSHDCAFLGKWHLGGHGVDELQPAVHGFEELAYHDSGASPFFKWQAAWNKTKPHFPTQSGKFRIGKAGEPTGEDYLTNDEKVRAVRYIESRKDNKKPFVLYYAPFAVHSPFQAPSADVKHFAEKKQIGHLGRNNATYAAMLKNLDDAVGAIRASLEKSGLAENTILIFTSDNGGVTYTEPAATTNAPFKGGKAMLYEGGVRVPTIVYQPDRFAGGKWSNAVIDCTDFLPTVAELTGNAAPEKIDGKSMLPLLTDPSSPGPERTLIWHYPFNVIVKHPDNGQPLSPHSGIRVGDHKLIWDWHGKLSLYNITKDPFEKQDLAGQMPELTTQLHTQLKTWLSANVAPRYFPKRDQTVPADSATDPFPFKDLR